VKRTVGRIETLATIIGLLPVVDKFLQFFSGFEIGDPFCGNIDGRSGFRISSFA
jgi:hypothetical protein